MTVASAVTPSNGALIPNASQPVTLTVTDAVVTDSSASVVYTFEVATDAGFSNKVQSKDAPQTPGQTAVKLDTLPAGNDYYWHVRAKAGDTPGPFSAGVKFTIGPALVLGAPSPASPANGTSLAGWPTLTVNSASRSGPSGTTMYRFDIALNSSFTSIVVTATVSESGSTTTFLTSQAVPSDTTQYFWRVTAIDQATGISGPASATQSFTIVPAKTRQAQLAAQLGLTLWPNDKPPGTNGHAVMGDNWQVQILTSFGGVRFQSPTIELLRLFDLMDLGLDPQSAIDWMYAHNYPTVAAYYSRVDVIGVQFVYLALINGRWDLILRAEGERIR